MRRSLERACAALGLIPIATGAAQIVLGAGAVPGAGSPSESADSELRFLSAFWLAGGVLLIWSSRDLDGRAFAFRLVCGALFLGGVARLIGGLAEGWPHSWLIVLMAIELALPPALLAWERASRG